MSEEEINEALKIIKEPITVNSIEYKCFSQENYEKLLSVYENAKWFVSNWEQALQNIKNLQQKVEQLEKENKELRDENKRIFQNVNDDELLISNAMNYAELKKAEKKVEQLENIRKEAIKLLKKCGIVDEKGNFNAYLDTIELKDLLNILNKGSEE